MAWRLNKNWVGARSSAGRVGRLRPAYYRAEPKINPRNSPFAKKPHRSGRHWSWRRIVYSLALALILIGLIYSSILKNNPRIILNDSSYHGAADYKSAITRLLGAFKNGNKLTIDEHGIVASLKQQFPELSLVKIKLSLASRTPTFDLTVAGPAFNLVSGQNLYVIGSNGVVASRDKIPESAKLPTLTDQSGFAITAGRQVISAASVQFINTVLAQCRRANLSIVSLVLPPVAQQLNLTAAGTSYYVKFDLNGDADLQAGQYLAAKHQFDSQGSGPQEYLDVRIPGKIYYK